MGLGDNTRAMLITRGLAEIARLGAALGADQHTFAGLAGMGDLVATCSSPLSRNRTFGEKLGRGARSPTCSRRRNQIAEGVTSSESVLELARKHGVEMPITEVVAGVVHEGLDIGRQRCCWPAGAQSRSAMASEEETVASSGRSGWRSSSADGAPSTRCPAWAPATCWGRSTGPLRGDPDRHHDGRPLGTGGRPARAAGADLRRAALGRVAAAELEAAPRPCERRCRRRVPDGDAARRRSAKERGGKAARLEGGLARASSTPPSGLEHR